MSVEVNARVGVRMGLDVGLKDKVFELPIGERVRSLSRADDLAVVDMDLAVVAEFPPGEILAVKERNPTVLVRSRFRRVVAGMFLLGRFFRRFQVAPRRGARVGRCEDEQRAQGGRAQSGGK